MAPKLWIALALAALAAGEARTESLEMQVEEPSLASPPIDPHLEAVQWKAKSPNPSLNKAQKSAYEKRRKLVETMASEVREKREALRNSPDAEKAARVKELEQLILDPALDAGKLDKLEKRLEKQAAAKAKSLEKKLEKQESRTEKSIEKNQEKLDKERDALDNLPQKNKGSTGK